MMVALLGGYRLGARDVSTQGTGSSPASSAASGGVSFPYGVTSATPRGIQGVVNGRGTLATPLAQRRVACATQSASTASVVTGLGGSAQINQINQINQIINVIERLHKLGGPSSELAEGMRTQLEMLVEMQGLLSNDGPMIGDSLETINRELVGLAKALGDHCLKLNELQEAAELEGAAVRSGIGAEINSAVEALYKMSGHVETQFNVRKAYLEQCISSSPVSLSKMYRAKADISSAAVAVLVDAKAECVSRGGGSKQRKAIDDALSSLKLRASRLQNKAESTKGKLGKPEQVIGAKLLTGFGAVLSPIVAYQQGSARDRYAADILSDPEHSKLDTPEVDEQVIMEKILHDTLKQAGLADIDSDRQFHAAMNQVLNGGDWSEVKTQIPLKTVNGKPQSATSTIAPAGTFMSLYPKKVPSSTGKLVAGGINAHSSTEFKHAVNLARTSVADENGRSLFSAMRHGVISAFGITAEEVGKMDDATLKPFVTALLPEGHWVQVDGSADMARTLDKVRAEPGMVDAMRQTANQNRAKEIVAATVMSDPGLIGAALAGKEPTVDILSISLLTPDLYRSSADENERRMVSDQMAAWKAVSGRQSIIVDDPATGAPRRVNVIIRPVAVNYGVNEGALSWFKGKGPLTSAVDTVVGGWSVSDEINDEGMKQLFGSDLKNIGATSEGVLGKRVADLERTYRLLEPDLAIRTRLLEQQIEEAETNLQSAQELVAWAMDQRGPEAEQTLNDAKGKLQRRRAEVNHAKDELASHTELEERERSRVVDARLLMGEIAAIHGSGAYREPGSEPYKMPTRLAVLGDLLGVKIAFNCKSGKDRTGELDAEIKHFHLQRAMNGEFPRYGRERSAEEKAQFREVVVSSGNFEMQRKNTGYAGYKVKGVPQVYEQFGGKKGDAVTNNFLGLSGYTAS